MVIGCPNVASRVVEKIRHVTERRYGVTFRLIGVVSRKLYYIY